VIINIDKSILDKISKTSDTLSIEDNPREIIKTVLTKANKERTRINEEMKRRKEIKENHKSGPPNKKHKKNSILFIDFFLIAILQLLLLLLFSFTVTSTEGSICCSLWIILTL